MDEENPCLVCSNEGPHPSQRGDDSKIVNKHGQFSSESIGSFPQASTQNIVR